MLRFVLLFNLMLFPLVICKRRQEKDSSESADDLGGKLVSDLRNDANIDLSADEEYEDLRAELLAYHTALASLTSSRRSMKTTPCWQLGGICIEKKMCEGHYSLTQVAGCRDKLEVCCFTWNKYQVRDMSDQGIGLAMPWSLTKDFGGLGVIDPPDEETLNIKKIKSKKDENIYGDTHHEKEVYDELHEDNNPPMLVILRHKKKT